MFKKTTMIHVKGEICKIKRCICNVPIEAANISNILSRPAVSSGLIVVKIKQDLKYRVLAFFETVRQHIKYIDIFNTLTYFS